MPHHDKHVRDVMTSSPRTIEPSTSLHEAARLMRDQDVGSLPIVEGDRLQGMLTDRDIAIRAVAEGKDTKSTTARDIASRDLVTVDPEQGLDEALRLMAKHQVRRLPVCEEDGKLVGILAQADAAMTGDEREVGRTVEEISR
jgi:CBS domain-containing protein